MSDIHCHVQGCDQPMAAVWHDTHADADRALCTEHAMRLAQLLDSQDAKARRRAS